MADFNSYEGAEPDSYQFGKHETNGSILIVFERDDGQKVTVIIPRDHQNAFVSGILDKAETDLFRPISKNELRPGSQFRSTGHNARTLPDGTALVSLHAEIENGIVQIPLQLSNEQRIHLIRSLGGTAPANT